MIGWDIRSELGRSGPGGPGLGHRYLDTTVACLYKSPLLFFPRLTKTQLCSPSPTTAARSWARIRRYTCTSSSSTAKTIPSASTSPRSPPRPVPYHPSERRRGGRRVVTLPISPGNPYPEEDYTCYVYCDSVIHYHGRLETERNVLRRFCHSRQSQPARCQNPEYLRRHLGGPGRTL